MGNYQNNQDLMRKLNILLAEDDEMIEKITTFYLRRNGHEVDVAKNGNEAVFRTSFTMGLPQ